MLKTLYRKNPSMKDGFLGRVSALTLLREIKLHDRSLFYHTT